MDFKLLKSTVNGILKNQGFKHNAGTWYRTFEDLIMIINLQKSSYGQQVYINFGLYFRQFGDDIFPKYYESHIQFRVSEIPSLKDKQKDLKEVFDLEFEDLDDKVRIEQISKIFLDFILPFFLKLNSIQDIQRQIINGEVKEYWATDKNAKTILSFT